MTGQDKPLLALNDSRLFTTWLRQAGSSLALTTYQAGKLVFIGLHEDGRLSVFERSFERPMGLGMGRGRFWMSSASQLWRFENFLDPRETHDGYDALFVPVTGHTTGDIDIHDIHEDDSGRPIFVATRFNCLATLAERGSFRELWRPPFIDRLASEDRCHMNGLAMEDGAPAFVTSLSRTNFFEGWREQRRDGGVVMNVRTDEVMAEGLSMPHSPRLYRGRLWMLQTGTGEFGYLDSSTGRFEPVCFLPGFARGLSFIGDHAVIGLSRPRENRTFEGLELNDRLEAERRQAQCGLFVVNITTGDIEHSLTLEGVVEEIYDVAFLPDTTRPKALGFRTDEIRFAIRPEAVM